jgi:hypothetical protein
MTGFECDDLLVGSAATRTLPMPAAGVLVSPLGERYYTAAVLAAALGISVKEVE